MASSGELYAELSERSRAIGVDFADLNRRWEDIPTTKEKASKAQSYSRQLAEIENRQSSINVEMEVLKNADPAIGARSYFKTNLNATHRLQFSELRESINETLVRYAERRADPEYETLKQQVEQLMAEQRGERSGENLLPMIEVLKEMVKNSKSTIPMPPCPSDMTQFLAWEPGWKLYLNKEHPGADGETKLELLRKACASAPLALDVISGFIAKDGQYDECMEMIRNRYDIPRVHAERYVQQLTGMAAYSDKDSSATMRKIRDNAITIKVNLKMLATRVMALDPDVDQELQIKAKCFDILWYTSIALALSPKTKAGFTTSRSLKRMDMPSGDDLLAYIETKSLNVAAENERFRSSDKPKSSIKASGAQAKKSAERKECQACNTTGHYLFRCKKFRNMSVKDRWEVVKKHKICGNCLKNDYKNCDCRKVNEKSFCKQCPAWHSDLLHDKNHQPRVGKPQQISSQVGVVSTLTITVRPTASIRITGPSGISMLARVLIDSGAEDSVITYEMCHLLKLKLEKTDIATSTFTGEAGPSIKHLASMLLSPSFEPQDRSNTVVVSKALVTAMTANIAPAEKVKVDIPEKFANKMKHLADPEFMKPGPIDMIIGAEVFCDLKKKGLIKLKAGEFQDTKVGWIFMGPARRSKEQAAPLETKNIFVVSKKKETIDPQDIRKFFDQPLEPEEREDFVQKFFDDTIRHDGKRYIAKIPFKGDKELGDSKNITFAITQRMFKKLPIAARQQFVDKCLEMEKDGNLIDPKGRKAKNFVACFALLTKSITTPLRVIIMCNQKTTNGLSVNDIQHTGPKLQKSMPMIIVGFRLYEFAVCGDISKMFWRIGLDEDDQAYQHTYVPINTNGDLAEKIMPNVIFGMNSSPFIANATLLQVAKDMEEDFPIGAKWIKEIFYVDDGFKSCSSLEEAAEGLKQMHAALKFGGFPLKKCAANDLRALKDIPVEDHLETTIKELKEDADPNDVNVFGKIWDKSKDILRFKIARIILEGDITWRVALASIMKIYDNEGLLGPVIMTMRILTQGIAFEVQEEMPKDCPDASKFRKRIWDKPASKETADKFKECMNSIHILEKIQVPRWLKFRDEKFGRNQICIFADASMKAYGWVAYARFIPEDKTENIQVTLMSSGGRVAPLSQKRKTESSKDDITLPRNELNSLHEAAKYVEKLRKEASLPPNVEFHGWGDSMIVLYWLITEENKLTVYVRNRTGLVKEAFGENIYHVPTEDNPADDMSRGLTPQELVDNKRFYDGPSFLKNREYSPRKVTTKEMEQKKASIGYQSGIELTTQMGASQTKLRGSEKDRFIVSAAEKYSDYKTTKTSLAYMLRWINKRTENKRFPLGVQERKEAEKLLIRSYQAVSFEEEIKTLKKGEMVSKGDLVKVTPFYDKENILRVGGRIANDLVPFDAAHPMILPKLDIPKDQDKENVDICPLTKKVLIWAHKITFHGGASKMRSVLSTRFYIPNLKNATRYIVNRCVECKRLKAEANKQLMGNIPRMRMCPSPPFYLVQLDYAGPFAVLNSTRRRSRRNEDGETVLKDVDKAWVCVIVDMYMGAMHLELVENLTPQSFISMFKRFVGERGLPKFVYCDNATTFVSAAKYLKATEKMMSSEAREAIFAGQREIHKQFADLQVTFLYDSADVLIVEHSPPLAPNFNGRSEAAVKQLKRHLVPMINKTKLTAMEVQTLLKQIQGMLNMRPLCAHDDILLTPGHFLAQRNLGTLPEDDYNSGISFPERYKKCQEIYNKMVTIHSDQLLNDFKQRQGMLVPGKNLNKGQVVLLVENNTPAHQWRMARVEEIFPGNDDRVRVVNVRDQNKKIFERSVRQLVKLPVAGAEEDEADSSKIPTSVETKQQEVPQQEVPEEVETRPRRSPRIKTKNASSIASSSPKLFNSAFWTLTMMCLLALFYPSASQKVHQITTNGIVFFEQSKVLLKTGTFHAHIETGLKPVEDDLKAEAYGNDLRNACNQAKRKLKIDISCDFPTIRRLQEQASSMIKKNRLQFKTRAKRDTNEHGAISRLFIWLFWSDSTTADKSSPMGVVKHAVTDFKAIERQLQTSQRNMKDEVDSTLRKIEEEDDKIFRKVDEQAVRLRINNLRDTTSENLERLLDAYSNLDNAKISTEELDSLMAKINQNLTNSATPPLGHRELEKLITATLDTSQDEYFIRLDIPVVDEHQFIAYYAIPMTSNASETIADVQPHTIIINEKLNLFLGSGTIVSPINSTFSITEKRITEMKKVVSSTDCVINTFFEHATKCRLRKIADDEDNWTITPINNLIFFISKGQKDLVCETTRRRIQETAGMIMVPPKCHIETASRIIAATHDETSLNTQHLEKFAEVPTAGWIEASTRATRTWKISTPQKTIDDSDLDVVMKEADNATWKFYTDQKYFFRGFVLAIIAILAWIWRSAGAKVQGDLPIQSERNTNVDAWMELYTRHRRPGSLFEPAAAAEPPTTSERREERI